MAAQNKENILDSVPILVLRKRAEFLRLRKGRRYSGKHFLVQGAKQVNPGSHAGVGFTVTTKIGNAVIRNRIKRRLREVVKAVFPNLAKPGFDYVLIARRAALRSDIKIIQAELSSALDHIHSIGAKGSKQSA